MNCFGQWRCNRAIAGVQCVSHAVFPSFRQILNAISRMRSFTVIFVHSLISRCCRSLLSCYKPLQDRIEVGLFLGADSITARLSASEGFEVHFVDEVIYGKLSR